MKWIVVFLMVLVLYVHVFNAIATLYFEKDRQLTLKDLWKRFFPSFKITIEM
jgi:hypothetical protein